MAPTNPFHSPIFPSIKPRGRGETIADQEGRRVCKMLLPPPPPLQGRQQALQCSHRVLQKNWETFHASLSCISVGKHPACLLLYHSLSLSFYCQSPCRPFSPPFGWGPAWIGGVREKRKFPAALKKKEREERRSLSSSFQRRGKGEREREKKINGD